MFAFFRIMFGPLLLQCSRPAEAEAELRATWQALQRVMGPRHPLALTIMQILGENRNLNDFRRVSSRLIQNSELSLLLLQSYLHPYL